MASTTAGREMAARGGRRRGRASRPTTRPSSSARSIGEAPRPPPAPRERGAPPRRARARPPRRWRRGRGGCGGGCGRPRGRARARRCRRDRSAAPRASRALTRSGPSAVSRSTTVRIVQPRAGGQRVGGMEGRRVVARRRRRRSPPCAQGLAPPMPRRRLVSTVTRRGAQPSAAVRPAAPLPDDQDLGARDAVDPRAVHLKPPRRSRSSAFPPSQRPACARPPAGRAPPPRGRPPPGAPSSAASAGSSAG